MHLSPKTLRVNLLTVFLEVFHAFLQQGVAECPFQSGVAIRNLAQNRAPRNFCSTSARTLIGVEDGITILKKSCVRK